MKVDACLTKALFIFFGLFLLVIAAGLVYLQTSANVAYYKQYEHFIAYAYMLVPYSVMVSVGLCLFIIGFLSLCAPIQDSRYGVTCFLVLGAIIIATIITTFVSGLIYRNEILPEVEETLDIFFQKYNGNNVESSTVDFIQEELQCCGITNYTSWENTTWYQANHTVPKSCCMNATLCTGDLKELGEIYTEGCENKLEDVLYYLIHHSMVIIVSCLAIELFCLTLLYFLYRQRNYRGYEML